MSTLDKSLKYLLIAGANAILLTTSLALWTDKIEVTLNPFVRLSEGIKITGISLLALSGMRILVSVLNKKAPANLAKKKLRAATLFTFIVSSYFYYTYVTNTYQSRFDEARQTLGEKIDQSPYSLLAHSANSLTYAEYGFVQRRTGFPIVSKSATNIAYNYRYDLILPDYLFELSYEVPADVEIEEIDFEDGTFSRQQSFEKIGDRKLVQYSEIEW